MPVKVLLQPLIKSLKTNFYFCASITSITLHCTMVSSNTGVIRPNIFAPDTDSQEEEEELLVEGPLQVDSSQL